MNERRFECSATVLSNEYICVAGGAGIAEEILDSVELYDTRRDQWVTLPAMNQNRSNFSLVEANGFLYAFGFHENVEKYDPWTGRWVEVSKTVNAQVLETIDSQRSNIKSESLFSGWIIGSCELF